uniref:hypothetical protein n=1 Tax=Paenibacillus terrae TaxID=159743 RepID=UPI0011A4C205|nr:hypothetical protein [Paenibacillus terrae]
MKKFTRTQVSKEKKAGVAILYSSVIMSLLAITLEIIDVELFTEFLILICCALLISLFIRRRINHRVRFVEGIKTLLYIGISMLTFISLLTNFKEWSDDVRLLNMFILIVSVFESISNYNNILILDDLK